MILLTFLIFLKKEIKEGYLDLINNLKFKRAKFELNVRL